MYDKERKKHISLNRLIVVSGNAKKKYKREHQNKILRKKCKRKVELIEKNIDIRT